MVVTPAKLLRERGDKVGSDGVDVLWDNLFSELKQQQKKKSNLQKCAVLMNGNCK